MGLDEELRRGGSARVVRLVIVGVGGLVPDVREDLGDLG